MATATQISTRALKRLAVLDSRATPDAHDIADCNEELSAMISSFETSGLSGDVLPLDSRFENALVDMLAVRVAPLFGIPVPADLRMDAAFGWERLQAAFTVVPFSSFDVALVRTGQCQVEGGRAFYRQWEPGMTVLKHESCFSDGSIYQAKTSGVTGTTAPAGTGQDIVDGTITWCFRSAVVAP